MSKLAEIRTRKGITQEEIGKQLHVPKSSVSAWEHGRKIPPKHIDKLTQILGISDKQLTANPEQETASDFILSRITEIYTQLDRAERAELLAAAERILEHRKG